MTSPAVPPAVCYPGVEARSPGDNVNLGRQTGRESVSRHDDCQHHQVVGGQQSGAGPTQREVLLKAVMFNKPERTHKMLTGLDQKGTWPGGGASAFPSRGWRATGREARPDPG